jgi:cytoskeletal protein RodZ
LEYLQEKKEGDKISMNSGKRVVLSTIIGVVLAVAMMISISTLTAVEQQPEATRAVEQPPQSIQAQPQPGEPSLENKAAGQEQAAPQDQSVLAANANTSIMVDPTVVATPFALALLAGAGVFLIMKKRVK